MIFLIASKCLKYNTNLFQAEAIAVSIAQAFTMAYECWKLALEAKRNGQMGYSAEQVNYSSLIR